MTESHTETRDGIEITVFMVSAERWAWRAYKGSLHATGITEAMNWLEAMNNAFDEAKRRFWTPEYILEAT